MKLLPRLEKFPPCESNAVRSGHEAGSCFHVDCSHLSASRGRELILSKRRVVFGFCAGRFFLLLTDFVCRRVLRSDFFVFRRAGAPVATHGGPHMQIEPWEHVDVAGRFYQSRGSELF